MVYGMSPDGKASTSTPIPPGQYQLYSQDNNVYIHVNSFSMYGPPDATFAQKERYLNRILSKQEGVNARDEYDLKGPVPELSQIMSSYGGGSQGSGNRTILGNQPSGTNGNYAGGSGSLIDVPSGVQVDVPEFTGLIATHPFQPQFIVAMYIEELPFHSHTFINDTTGGDNAGGCNGVGDGHYAHLLLKPAR
jgi:hypothetical protein